MKCEWSILDKIEKDCEKANLSRRFSSLILFSLKHVVSNKIRLQNHLCLLFKLFHLLVNISSTCLISELVNSDAGKKSKK